MAWAPDSIYAFHLLCDLKSLSLSGLPCLYRGNETNGTALVGLCEGQINDSVNEECLLERLTVAGGAVGTSAVGLADEGKGAAEGVRVRVSWPGLKCSHVHPSLHVPRFSEGRRAPPSGRRGGGSQQLIQGLGLARSEGAGYERCQALIGASGCQAPWGTPVILRLWVHRADILGGRPQGSHSDPQGSC